MYKRNGTDTLIGFIPGADVNEGTGAVVGGLAASCITLRNFLGWTGTPICGNYSYPAGGANENWDFQKSKNAVGPVNIKAFGIPNGYTITDVRNGKCDPIWQQRAQYMVAQGQGEAIYQPGYEGSDTNFNGSAGLIVPASTPGGVTTPRGYVLGAANWAYAVNRQIHVMRQVAGWDCWIDINYDVRQATNNHLDPDPWRLLTESFQSLGCELYPYDAFNSSFSAGNPADHAALMAYIQAHVDLQQTAAHKYGVPIMFGEAAPMIRNDTHTSGDDDIFVQFMADYCQDLNNNVFCLMLYNGITGDTSRCFNWNATTKTWTKNTAQFPRSANKIQAVFDPADFINRTAPTGTMYTQAELDAAVAAQKALDDASSGAAALAAMTADRDAQHTLLLSTQTELAEAYAQIQKTKDDWATFWSNFGGPSPWQH